SNAKPDANLTKAVQHLETAVGNSAGEPDPNVRAMLARLYLRAEAYDKAIPLLTELVNQEPGWQDGPPLLAEAYSGAGRDADAIAWLEQAAPDSPQLYGTLAEFYEHQRQWKNAAGAYEKAIEASPRAGSELTTRYASVLLNAGTREDISKAR